MEGRHDIAAKWWSRSSLGVGAAITLLLLAAEGVALLFAAALGGIDFLPVALVPVGLAVWLSYSLAGYGSAGRFTVLVTSFAGALVMLVLLAAVF